ncbi:DUF6351 family protein [Quisquiliibacterium transsilvanicum]|uniref:DUF6351 domain-containing protein n=1 Tax=Quisquiliibacterium transsilvanicum TaxID=1549638 RepID=A0A7W8HJG5_9BURK|nr:DUF6351 family protein [Quisquiliibacterium transsilvanicum]MBB5272333.1 hypothetical protein [Quisquiliibacterium transsilvanicum]
MGTIVNRFGRAAGWTVVLGSMALAACGGSGDGADQAAASAAQQRRAAADTPGLSGPARTVKLSVLSSAPQWVSGGDARIEVRAAKGLHDKLELWLNGARVQTVLQSKDDRLEGVISGLAVGENRLEVRHRSSGERDTLVLTNWPITGPMFSGPQQHPFVCTAVQNLAPAPALRLLVDSVSQPGYRVTDADGKLLGYSRDCSVETVVSYQYRSTGNAWKALPEGPRPADMSTVTLADGRTVDFIVRREVGSINRFLYSFAMLAPAGENPAAPDLGLWNRKLLYWFQGGVAVGHSQGTVHGGSMNPDILKQGYAIVHSSGNNTGTHYNMNLAGETAMMTKERFVERYGAPLYTIGLGGSGGAIQQYLIAQNNPGVLDGLLPVQSYPDMVTQTIHVGDCELLEYYMDATDRANPKWRTTKNRSLLVGMNAEEGFAKVNDALAPLKTALGYSTAPGTTECIPAWRGLTPLAMNPWYGQAPNQQNYEPLSDIAAIRWTHYDDLRNVYGVDATGAARPTWDNVGVQYGLASLKAGSITPAEFLRLNWTIGGWKHPSQMAQETFPFFGTGAAEIQKAQTIPGYFDPWSSKNMNASAGAGMPMPRTKGDPIAMRAAYASGHVFDGKLDVPAIDHRQYMERELDMHNSHQSFAVRKRVLNRAGNSDNLVIWFTDTIPNTPKASQSLEALAVMDQWLANIRANPKAGIAANKPPRAVDACYDRFGQLMQSGPGVWSGILDAGAPGACTQAFPLYTTSRIVAGAPIEGSIYDCTKKPVDDALADGTYAPWVPGAAEVAQLKQIFPEGVCDYRQPDRARP